jgi:hypothetical protein
MYRWFATIADSLIAAAKPTIIEISQKKTATINPRRNPGQDQYYYNDKDDIYGVKCKLGRLPLLNNSFTVADIVLPSAPDFFCAAHTFSHICDDVAPVFCNDFFISVVILRR